MGFPKGRGAALPFGRPTGFIPRGGEIKLIFPEQAFAPVPSRIPPAYDNVKIPP